jgi:hypothetical protein
MAIAIVANLSAAPNPAKLPVRVEFTQTLKSTLAEEKILVRYSLASAHNVWFEDADDQLTKKITREETVGTAAQVCVDRLQITTGPRTGGMLTIEVHQAIRDSEGNVGPDLVVVQLA